MLGDLDAVLFDLDGTLIDASEVICTSFNAALTRYGLDPLPVETVKLGIGRPLRELFSEEGKDVSVDLLVEEYRRVFRELSPGRSRLLPGVKELLASLPKHQRLGVVTSRSSTGTIKILRDLALLDRFSVVVGVEDVPNGKPNPEPVLFALKKVAVQAHNSAFIGDTPYDMEAGSRAGTRTIGVTTGSHSRQQLLDAGADLVVNDLFGLRKRV
jgi:HAD superfamily hydrolase (TIGR01509 family)